jgi:hypothetical protein
LTLIFQPILWLKIRFLEDASYAIVDDVLSIYFSFKKKRWMQKKKKEEEEINVWVFRPKHV